MSPKLEKALQLYFIVPELQKQRFNNKEYLMISYKDLGLVNTKEMFAKAVKGGYAIPAYNFNNMEQLQAVIGACVETSSPVILQVSAGARKICQSDIASIYGSGCG
jgi:fructose-bisphosphate aldolase class II